MRIFLTAILALTIYATGALAWMHPGTPPLPPLTCPYATDGGCAGANQNSNYLNTGFLTNAVQSGQSSILNTHPQPNNMAGVDYPVGYDTTLTLKDPIANPPAGFTYSGPGSGGPKITTTTGGNATVDGYDLYNPEGVGPVQIVIGSNQTGAFTTTITNNKMGNSATQNGGITAGGAAALVMKYNTFIDQGAAGTAGFFLLDNRSAATGTVDIEYNAFLSIGGARIFGGPRGGGARTFKYNYVYGVAMKNLGHGEIELYGGQSGQTTPISLIDYEYNTIVLPLDNCPTCVNATYILGTGVPSGTDVTTLKLIGNTSVINKTSGSATAGSGLFAAGWRSLGDVTIQNNYLDPTGSFGCGTSGLTSQSTTASASGNTLTITATNMNNGSWEPGNELNGPGFTQAKVLPYGTTDPNTGLPSTGTGGTGTYVYDGSSQTVASTSGWLRNPFINSATVSGNINLTNGSALAYAAPTLQAPLCNGHT